MNCDRCRCGLIVDKIITIVTTWDTDKLYEKYEFMIVMNAFLSHFMFVSAMSTPEMLQNFGIATNYMLLKMKSVQLLDTAQKGSAYLAGCLGIEAHLADSILETVWPSWNETLSPVALVTSVELTLQGTSASLAVLKDVLWRCRLTKVYIATCMTLWLECDTVSLCDCVKFNRLVTCSHYITDPQKDPFTNRMVTDYRQMAVNIVDVLDDTSLMEYAAGRDDTNSDGADEGESRARESNICFHTLYVDLNISMTLTAKHPFCRAAPDTRPAQDLVPLANVGSKPM